MKKKGGGQFLDRFKGRTHVMNIEGHVGLVKNTFEGIDDRPILGGGELSKKKEEAEKARIKE